MTSKKIFLLPLALPVTWSLAGPLHAATVTSIASGEWDLAETWDSGTAAPVTGTQGTGDDYIIADTFTVTSNDPASNAQAIIGQSLTVQGGGVLDLARLHALQAQSMVWDLPAITLEDGSELQFRSSTGTSNHALSANIATSGTVLIENTGGSYGQDIGYSGVLSGSGTIEYKTAASGSALANRTLALKSADSPFTGEWFIQHLSTSSDDYATLQADAANALGSGSVILDTRAQLINNATGGLDSLGEITIQHLDAKANLGSGWTNPAGILNLNDGYFNLGSGKSFGTASIATVNHVNTIAQFDLGGTPSESDKIIVSGDYNGSDGMPVDIRLTTDPGSNTYDLITYGGTFTGDPNVLLTPSSRLTADISTGSGTNDKVTVSFSGSVADLVWKGNDGVNPNNWDAEVTTNFEASGAPDVFYSLDHVTFDDTAASFTPSVTGTLTPSSVTFDNSVNPYTLAGTGSITGATGLVKNGTAAVTISNPNTFTGDVSVNAGTLIMGKVEALGATGNKNIIVADGGTLDFNGISPGTGRAYSYTIAGTGSGSGALTNSSSTSVGGNSGIKDLTLTADATIGGTGRFDVGRVGSTSGIITGNGHTLTKAGGNQIQLRGDASATPISIVVNGGILGAEDQDNAFGGATGDVTVNSGAKIGTYGPRNIPTPVTLNEGSSIYNQGNAGSTWSGTIDLAGNATIEANGQSVTTAAITGEGLLTKTGNNTLILNGSRTGDGGSDLKLGNLRAMVDDAFGTGTVTVSGASGAGQTRVELQGVTVANDFVLNSAAQTGYTGPLTARGGLTSTVNGTVTISSAVGNGGHLASVDAGSVLRLNGELVITNGVVPNIRVGTVELAGGGSYPRLDIGEGTVRLGADNGISTAAQLRLAVSNPTTFDLNGFDQTLERLERASTNKTAAVTNTAATPSELTISSAVDHSYTGTIDDGTGGISLVKDGSSVFTLAAASTYTGSTTINGGTLVINASHGVAASSPITVNAGGTLGGVGPVNGDITVSGSVAPGNSAGLLLTNGSVAFGPGSEYAWEIGDWTGSVAGADWDLVDAVELAFTATPAEKLTIVVSGDAANFTESGKTFEIARSVDAITGFNASAIEIDDSAFAGSGTWSVQMTGNSVELVYSAGSGTPYSNWASANGIPGATADMDSDNDGVLNGIEFVIGGDPAGGNSNALLPTITTDETYINFTFRRTDESAGENPFVEYSSTLSGDWTEAESGVDGVIIEETNNGFDEGVDSVTVKIPQALADGAKLFARLHVDAE